MGNLEKILVGIIIVTIVAILGLAIWGLGGHEDGKHPGTASSSAPPSTSISPEKEPIPDAVGRSQAPAVTEIPSSPTSSSSEVSKIASGFGDLVNGSGSTTPSSGAPSFTSSSSSSTPAADPPISSAPASSRHSDPYPTFAERAPKYDVKKGDTYEKIARAVLGDSKRWKEIQSLNADVPPSKLHPGMQLVVPDATAASRTAALPKTTPKETSVARESAPSAAKSTSGSTHTVKKGETLYGIAREYLHDGNKWKLIAQANPDKIRGSSDIVVGSTLRIPTN